MRLKKLEIVGFKSFPERTKVHLVDGVTAIVGPNGCGKTNILDALRWVMGEQRPTLLRGGKMEDVIFNGSQGMKAHGLAEVSLSIENTRGVLPSEYNELLLTRRLFRSGESEYMLNRTPCRLKDIVDLFADTGMGANAYSVIQQHMIDALISDKAEERRTLFEEAAGITKYKQRKRAAILLESWPISKPRTKTLPAVGISSPPIMLKRVLLPEPDGPMIETYSAWLT